MSTCPFYILFFIRYDANEMLFLFPFFGPPVFSSSKDTGAQEEVIDLHESLQTPEIAEVAMASA